MTLHVKTLIWVATILPMISACELQDKLKNLELQKLIKTNNVPKTTIKTKTVSIKCQRGNIKEYTDKGWQIIGSKSDEVTCTWKTKKARRGCNLENDKGCRITVPDKIGKITTYNLEKEITLE